MGKIILLIDDDIDDTELFTEALVEADPTSTCYSGDDGHMIFKKLEDKIIPVPDIIFLDINMPSISGWECLKYLKANELLKKIPVIMYSTSSHEREMKIADELGAEGFFAKPHDYNELVNMLKGFILAPVLV